MFGVHLAGLYLAGFAMAWFGRIAIARVRRRIPRPEVAFASLLAVALVVLAPAWIERRAWAAQGAVWIREQARFDATDGADVAELVAIAERSGPGRIYAGSRANWGAAYRVGQVPVYAELLNLDVEAVGFTRPTWSLSSPAEYRFRDSDPAHYDVFDVRYLIQPVDRAPPVEAELVAERGRHALWAIAGDGGVEIVDASGPITADRTNLGVGIAPWLSSELPEADVHPAIAFAGIDAPVPTLPEGDLPTEPPGEVVEVTLDLAGGRSSSVVEIRRPAAVILKASFDNRWRVTVDGLEVQAQMFAPSFVGRVVPPGRHEITFEYVPFPRYDLLLALGAGTFASLLVLPSRLAGRRSDPRQANEGKERASAGAGRA